MKPSRGGSMVDPSSPRLTVFLACILLLSLYFLCETRTVIIEPVVNFQVLSREGDARENVLLGGPLDPRQVPGRREEGGEGRDSSMECDFSEVRTDICEIHGDIRVHGPSSSIVRVPPPLGSSSSTSTGRNRSGISISINNNSTVKIKPYPRKWEPQTMLRIRELSINTSLRYSKCDVKHNSPAVVFSTGGFRRNFFHEMVDAIIPIFLTSFHFHGDVHFLVQDVSKTWVNRYLPVLRILSNHDGIINLDDDHRVHCFNHVVVGLNSTMEMGIDPVKSPMGPSMFDFTAFLRRSFALPRELVDRHQNKSKPKPKLLFLSRRETRVLLNEREVVEMVGKLGYEVLVATPDITRDLTRMASMVNSCDVMLGLHGAGLTNMVFLPANATLIQIIPWGAMLYPSRYSYGDPAIAMGLRYADYEITMDESSLINKYPRDHAVFTDPLSIHKQGFYAMWSIFWHQDIKLDVARFRDFLSKALATS